jgi:RNA polymerase sigma-70 factor (ECF subfamily)
MMNQGSLSQSRILSDPAEKEVMAAVSADVPGAFERLVELYQRRVLHVMTQLVGSRQEAEDLTQDLFLKVFRARKAYRPESRLSTWIFTIAHNLAINHLRSRKRSKVRTFQAGPETTDGDTAPLTDRAVSAEGTPSARMRKLELAEIVQEALARLSEDQRMAILLNKFEEMSYAEIAQVMGRSESAVKSLLTRARENLKTRLEAYATHGIRPSLNQEDSETTEKSG